MSEEERRQRIAEALKRASRSVAGLNAKQLHELTEKAFKIAAGK